MRFFLLLLLTILYTSFLPAEIPSFKFTLGSNLGNFPLEINKMSKNIKNLGGLKINSWVLSPNFSSFLDNKRNSNLSENKHSKGKESLYIKFNIKF